MLLKKISLQSYCKVTRKKKKYKHFEDPVDCVEFNDLNLELNISLKSMSLERILFF